MGGRFWTSDILDPKFDPAELWPYQSLQLCTCSVFFPASLCQVSWLVQPGRVDEERFPEVFAEGRWGALRNATWWLCEDQGGLQQGDSVKFGVFNLDGLELGCFGQLASVKSKGWNSLLQRERERERERVCETNNDGERNKVDLNYRSRYNSL